jgi:hypothetical protein
LSSTLQSIQQTIHRAQGHRNATGSITLQGLIAFLSIGSMVEARRKAVAIGIQAEELPVERMGPPQGGAG